MADADILLGTNSIKMTNGDVSVDQKLTVSGDTTLKGQLTVQQQIELLDSFVISKGAGNPVVTIDTDGALEIRSPNS